MVRLTASLVASPCPAKAFKAQATTLGRLPGLVQHRTAFSPCRPSQPARVAQPERRAVQTQVAQELFELADVGSFVGGTAATMFAMTLIGLAIGFVFLRVEALVEEGKL